jgi:lysophospholipase L1-like esterase
MRRTLGGLIVLALTSTGLFTSVAAPAQAAGVPAVVSTATYAALGDSFAAGYGLPSKSDPASQACARSNLAYPELLNGLPRLKKLDFEACSGSTVADVVAGQLGSVGPEVRTVTLTIGGNDVGFGALTCLQDDSCDPNAIAAQATAALSTLGPRLGGLLAGIAARAPNARIFVTGYPELFGSSARVFGTKTACPVSLANRSLVNGLTVKLNSVIKATVSAVRAGGVTATYVSVAGAFDGHGVCDSRAPFISTVLHPNAAGQLAYAAVLAVKGVAR